MLFRPRHEAPSMMLLADRFLLRRTPTPGPIRRVQSVVARPPARPVGSDIGDGKLMSHRWKPLVASLAAPRISHCVAERSNCDRGTRCATSLEGGREASKRLWRERDSAMKLGADLVSRGHRYRPLARWSAQLCGRRRRSCAPLGARSSPSIQGTGDASGTRSSAVRGHGQVRCQPDAAAGRTGHAAVRSEYRAPARPLEIRRLGCWSVRSGRVATSSRTEVVAGGREDDVGRITVAVFEAASAEVAVHSSCGRSRARWRIAAGARV
jgi:hypothetical protein